MSSTSSAPDSNAPELTRVQRYGDVFSIPMLDLDHFKELNDRRGHHAGDEAMTSAERIRADRLGSVLGGSLTDRKEPLS